MARYKPGNPVIYPVWVTPEEHPAIVAAVETYKGTLSPHIESRRDGNLHPEPRVDRWMFSTDGGGFSVPPDGGGIDVPERKRWVPSGVVKYPATSGIGPGVEQNTHKIGECVDLRELRHTVAFLARFPSVFVATGE